MSLVADSPGHSSSSGDFNALLTELDEISDDPEEILELEDNDAVAGAFADPEHVLEVGDGDDARYTFCTVPCLDYSIKVWAHLSSISPNTEYLVILMNS